MNFEAIITEIDREIDRLQTARNAMMGLSGSTGVMQPVGKKLGHPPKVAVPATATATPVKKRSTLSPEGRARLVEAMKKRWASSRALKKAAKKKATTAGA
jgi:hypothetical protein